MIDTTPLLYSVAQAAKLLGIGRATLYVMLETEQIKSVRIGRLRRIHRDEIARVANEGASAREPGTAAPKRVPA
jgi:excisionase family DNA binding protein